MAVAEGPLAQCPPQGQRQLLRVRPPRSLSNGRPRPARAVVSASLAGVVGAAPVVAPLRRGGASRSRELVKSNARTRTGTLRAIPVLDQVPWGVSGLLPRTPNVTASALTPADTGSSRRGQPSRTLRPRTRAVRPCPRATPAVRVASIPEPESPWTPRELLADCHPTIHSHVTGRRRRSMSSVIEDHVLLTDASSVTGRQTSVLVLSCTNETLVHVLRKKILSFQIDTFDRKPTVHVSNHFPNEGYSSFICPQTLTQDLPWA